MSSQHESRSHNKEEDHMYGGQKNNTYEAIGIGGWLWNCWEGSKAQVRKNVLTPQVDLFMLQEFIPSFKHAFARLDLDILADLDKSKCLTICPLELYVSLAVNICSYFISSISTNQTVWEGKDWHQEKKNRKKKKNSIELPFMFLHNSITGQKMGIFPVLL